MSCHPGTARRAFTLMELLLVTAVVAILAGLLMPAVATVRSSALAVRCKGNLRQCYLGHLNYAQDNAGWLPLSSFGNPQTPWFLSIAPYLEKSDPKAGGYTSAANVAPVTSCAAIMANTKIFGGNNPGYGFLRNNILYADSAGVGNNDYSNSLYPKQFRLSKVTSHGSRVLVGDGWNEGTGTTEPSYFKGSVTASVTDLGYYYRHQWSTLIGANGQGAADPSRINTDFHRGRRSYVMCDGSGRTLTDDYTNSANGLWTSLRYPWNLP